MKKIPVFLLLLQLTLLTSEITDAVEVGWDERLAQSFSKRLKNIKTESSSLSADLENLPIIPIDDQGGTGGFACIHLNPCPVGNARHTIDVQWNKRAIIDMVALVPARRYNAKGLDPIYGMPEEFTVELLNANSEVILLIAEEQNIRNHPVRHGHPFVYPISPPMEAYGLRISAKKLIPDIEHKGNHVHAWAEVFAFDGEKNIAHGCNVTSSGGAAPSSPWHWKPEFLVDDQTPLGLPEIPTAEHRNVGWLSKGQLSANESTSMTLDLGESVTIDGVRLLPARRPTSDLPSGFGFPKKLKISLSQTGNAENPNDWNVLPERQFHNPGHNPVLVSFVPTRARYIKIEATELWKDFESYPAFFALSEIEVLNNTVNLAVGKSVRSSDGMPNMIGPGGTYWSETALSDGFGPDGRLVSIREWLLQLDKRLRIESQCYNLRLEASQLIRQWRNTGLILFILLGLSGAFVMIALPIRYRIHSRKELLKVRERIAGDLHDEVGSNLGSIQMFANLAEGRSGPSQDLKRIQRIASETVSAVRDIVWLLRPGKDHRIGAVEHLRETSSIMLESLNWEFTANEDAWQVELPEDTNRHLFLFFREALHNILRHSQAMNVELRVKTNEKEFQLTIADDGVGIDSQRMERPATLRALRQRSESLKAVLHIESNPQTGTRLTLIFPIGRKH